MYKYLFVQLFLLSTINWANSQQTIENGPIIKVLTFNILHGRTMNSDFDLDKIAQVIINADPDLVALQEVDYKTNRAKKYDLATELGWRAKMAPIFGRAMYYDDGEYGEAVLSRYTMINSRNIGLPHLPDSEPRAALEITTVLPSGDTISFIGSHLDHLKVPTDRIQQAKEINQVFKNNKYPTILAGDLNDVPGSESMNILESIWKASYDPLDPDPTFPSSGPVKKIDYVLFLPQHQWNVLDKKVICDLIASDHCGYLVTLQLMKD